MALQNGEIDLVAQLPAAGTDLFKDDDNFVMDSVTSTRTSFLMYNLNTPALQDVNVRNAYTRKLSKPIHLCSYDCCNGAGVGILY